MNDGGYESEEFRDLLKNVPDFEDEPEKDDANFEEEEVRSFSVYIFLK